MASAARKVELRYEPRSQFIPFHQSDKRWSCLVIHRRAGKTVATINDLIISALTNQKLRPQFAYVAPYYHQAKRVAWDYLKHYSEPFWQGKPNESELRVELYGDRRISLYGADNADSLRGIYLDGVILDEFGDFRPSVWGNVIRPSLSDRKGWACFCGTPKGRNEFWAIRELARKNPQDWFHLELRADESGLIDAGELEQAQRQLTPEQYAQEFLCDFAAALPGAYFGRELVACERGGRIRQVDYDKATPVFTAWDIGYRDDTAIWFYQVIRGEVHVIDYHASSGQSVEFYAKIIADKNYDYECHWLPHDAKAKTLASGGKSIVEQLASYLGLNKLAIVPNLDVQDGIQAARLVLQRTWFDEGKCTEGLEALRQYQREYDEDKKAFREKPRHDWTCFDMNTEVLTRYGTHRILDLPENGEVLTPCGWKRYLGPKITQRNARLVEVAFTDGTTVKCTPDHLFLTDSGWKSAESLAPGSLIRSSLTLSRSILMAVYTAYGRARNTCLGAARNFIEMFGRWHSVPSLMVATSITGTATQETTNYQTWNAYQPKITYRRLGAAKSASSTSLQRLVSGLLSGISLRKAVCGTDATRSDQRVGKSGRGKKGRAPNAGTSSWPLYVLETIRNIVLRIARFPHIALVALTQPRRLVIASVRHVKKRADVGCIHVPDGEWFSLANGAVVHNSHPSDAFRMLAVAWREQDPRPQPEELRTLAVGPDNEYTVNDMWQDHEKYRGRTRRI